MFLKFTEEERGHAIARLSDLGITRTLGVVPEDAKALLWYITQVLEFTLVLGHIDAASLRITLAMLQIVKSGDCPIAPSLDSGTAAALAEPTVHLPVIQPPTANLPTAWSVPTDTELQLVAAHLKAMP